MVLVLHIFLVLSLRQYEAKTSSSETERKESFRYEKIHEQIVT